MRTWVMKLIKCNILLGFLLVSFSNTVYGMEEQLQQAVVLPIDYNDKAFVRENMYPFMANMISTLEHIHPLPLINGLSY